MIVPANAAIMKMRSCDSMCFEIHIQSLGESVCGFELEISSCPASLLGLAMAGEAKEPLGLVSDRVVGGGWAYLL